ncbi:MAG: hypothetical protein EA355_02890 [Rhodobacteraceae bacterium]|nr:MAG: hypothetical protein EA355_02890 [Paracoccaceae bacterium]
MGEIGRAADRLFALAARLEARLATAAAALTACETERARLAAALAAAEQERDRLGAALAEAEAARKTDEALRLEAAEALDIAIAELRAAAEGGARDGLWRDDEDSHGGSRLG